MEQVHVKAATVIQGQYIACLGYEFETREYWETYAALDTDSENESEDECGYCEKYIEALGNTGSGPRDGKCRLCVLRKEKRKKKAFLEAPKKKKCVTCKKELNRSDFDYHIKYFYDNSTSNRSCKECTKKTLINKATTVPIVVSRISSKHHDEKPCVSCAEMVKFNQNTLSCVFVEYPDSYTHIFFAVCEECILTKNGIQMFSEDTMHIHRSNSASYLLRTDVPKTVNCLACTNLYTNRLSEGICDKARGFCIPCCKEVVTARLAKRYFYCDEGHLAPRKAGECTTCKKNAYMSRIPELVEELNGVAEFDDHEAMMKVVTELYKKLSYCIEDGKKSR